MRRSWIPPLLLAILFSLFLPGAGGAVAPSPSNAGFAGLWEYPTAGMPGDGRGWIGLSRYSPYQPYYLSLGYLPWLEFNLRFTRFLRTDPKKSDPDYAWGENIDKALDVKVLLAKQRGAFPSVAAGFADISGTRLLEGAYLVATYDWGRAAITLGYGTDRYNGFFGGVEWSPWDWLTVKGEYSPLDYGRDAAHPGTGVDPRMGGEKWNGGLVFRTPAGVDASVSWQRGEEFCWGLSWKFDLSEPLFGERPRGPSLPGALELEGGSWNDEDLETAAGRIMEDLQNGLGIRDVHVFFGGRRALVAYESTGRLSQPAALATALLLAVRSLPGGVEELVMVPRVRGEAVVRLSVSGSLCASLRRGDGDLSLGKGVSAAFVEDLFGRLPGEEWKSHYGPDGGQSQGRTTAKLILTTEIRMDRPTTEPFFMSRQNLDLVADHGGARGWAARLDVRQPLNNDVRIWWEPCLNDETRIRQGVASWSRVLGKGFFGVAEAGWLDDLWAGANLWGRKFLGDGSLWIGARGSLTHPRDPESFAGLADGTSFSDPVHGKYLRDWNPDEWTLSWWLQAGYYEGRHNLDLMAEYGRFIDGDRGVRLSAMRWWDDVGIGFYLAATDVKVPGEDYTRVGALLDIPVGFFGAGANGVERWTEDIRLNSAWVYDGGRQPGTWQSPEQLWGELQPERLRNGLLQVLERMLSPDGGKGRTGRVYGLLDEFREEK